MNVRETTHPASSSAKPAEHFDVLIVGAGISGIGSAYHLSAVSKNEAACIRIRRHAWRF